MPDPLLHRLNENPIRRRWQLARAEVVEMLDAEGAESAIGDLAAWLQSSISEDELGAEETRLSSDERLTSLVLPLRLFSSVEDEAIGRKLMDAVSALLRQREDAYRDVAAVLLGGAVASVLADRLDDQEVAAEPLVASVWPLGGTDGIAYLELVVSLAKSLRDRPGSRAALLRWLENRVTGINEHPREGVPTREGEAFDRFVEEWRQRPSLIRLWRETAGSNFLANFGDLDIAIPILIADHAGALRRLDKLRFPHPLQEILGNRAIRDHPGLLVELLRCAPPCACSRSEWNGSLLAVLLLNEADDHCRQLWRNFRNGNIVAEDEEVEAALSSWMLELARVVMSRKDGAFLSAQWLRLKVEDELLERRLEPDDSMVLAQTNMIEWIAAGLVKSGVTGATIGACVEFPKREDRITPKKPTATGSDADRSPCVPALAMMVMVDCMIGDEPASKVNYLDRLDDLLVARDRGFEIEASLDAGATGVPASCIGYLLANGRNPAERWLQSWRLLVEQRRAVQHWRCTRDSEALAPSLFLVAAGIAALDWLCSEPLRHRGESGKLWRALFDAVRECWLTVEVAHGTDRIKRDIGRIFARHRIVFHDSAIGDSQGTNLPYSEMLANDLNALGGDDVLMAICCDLAHRNGTPASVLAEVLQHDGGKGDRILRQFERWQKLEHKVKQNPKLTQIVKEMLAEIDAARER